MAIKWLNGMIFMLSAMIKLKWDKKNQLNCRFFKNLDKKRSYKCQKKLEQLMKEFVKDLGQ